MFVELISWTLASLDSLHALDFMIPSIGVLSRDWPHLVLFQRFVEFVGDQCQFTLVGWMHVDTVLLLNMLSSRSLQDFLLILFPTSANSYLLQFGLHFLFDVRQVLPTYLYCPWIYFLWACHLIGRWLPLLNSLFILRKLLFLIRPRFIFFWMIKKCFLALLTPKYFLRQIVKVDCNRNWRIPSLIIVRWPQILNLIGHLIWILMSYHRFRLAFNLRIYLWYQWNQSRRITTIG